MINPQIPITKRGFDLEERTLRFAKTVIWLSRQLLQRNTINRELISQLVRASGSVGANYREANDASSKKDFAYRIRITQREAKEAHYWLQLVAEANPELDGEVNKLLQEALELKKIFAAIAAKAR